MSAKFIINNNVLDNIRLLHLNDRFFDTNINKDIKPLIIGNYKENKICLFTYFVTFKRSF